MSQRILILQGHPDSTSRHLNHLLAAAYADGAAGAGHEVRSLNIAEQQLPMLLSRDDWENGDLSEALEAAQQDIEWAGHLVLFYPLWLGGMPAVVKAFLEQVARPGFAFRYSEGNPFGIKGLKGRSARIVITMGMPAPVYRWFFRAHSLKALERNILGFIGIAPIRHTIIGMVEKMSEDRLLKLQRQMQKLGQNAR